MGNLKMENEALKQKLDHKSNLLQDACTKSIDLQAEKEELAKQIDVKSKLLIEALDALQKTKMNHERQSTIADKEDITTELGELKIDNEELKQQLNRKSSMLQEALQVLEKERIEEKQTVKKLEKDVISRDQVIDKLTAEYEKAKAKIRRYRSMKMQTNESTNPSHEVEINSKDSLGDGDHRPIEKDEED